ncbi:hypothetical protein FEM48_Zijuj11G0113500 [Ziziphus jujuba var. spinosa]|uniref:Receptor-like protein 12 n=1 Tax=Ziziphus jujuba var. spinosa TaxID=714518 RepID=A0A978UIN0_ZIZJJ|nr:hypothetical protein FEM48_Zijuj11G0113500 [Ziziphus jujuba var. spinosa]
MELVKILTAFTSIDFSSNEFQGQIPKELGQLKSLLVLNLSNNVLSGQIPSSFGNLGQLESLDLSRNHLNGTIPQSLSVLNFLSFMNLSYNQLVGRIPNGNQIQTFPADYFQGNEGLCGPPLKVNCPDGHVPGKLPKTPNQDKADSKSGIEIEWNVLSAEVGFLVGFGSVIWSLVFWKRWRKWYFNVAEDIAFSILPQPLLRQWMLWKVGKPRPRRNHGRRAI